jgi:hypothetical protein
MATRMVPLNLIDVPKKWRPVKKPKVAELVLTLRIDGLLQAIGLRANPEKPGRYLLVFGRHRLEAARNEKWEEIEARVMDLDDEAAASATNAENLFRNPLTAAERVVALKSWSEQYRLKHPQVHGKGKAGGAAVKAKAEAAKKGAEPAPQPKSFPAHVAEVTGIPKSTAKDLLAVGRNLTDEEAGVLAERDVPLGQIRQINKLPEEKKKVAVALIASGVGAGEAVAQATLPPNATIEKVGDPDQSPRSEADMGDDEWLETYCGEVLARLKYKEAYRRDALLYRKIRDHTATFRSKTKAALSQSKVQVVGPFFLLVARFVNCDHPKVWNPCGPCGGTGQSGDKSKCGFCNGHAYALKGGGR